MEEGGRSVKENRRVAEEEGGERMVLHRHNTEDVDWMQEGDLRHHHSTIT